MRELAVFYCPKCGYYAYYQTSRHPQCPRCCHPDVMHMARMYYKEFMDMGCRERDDYLAQEIMRLDTENKILSDTVKWMHDTIWEMIREQKGYTDQSAAQIINSLQDDKSTHTDH